MRKLAAICVVALAALTAAAVGVAKPTVGVDCVKPVNLQGSFEDLRNCNLKGVTITQDEDSDGLYASNLTGANLLNAHIGGGYKPLQYAVMDGANLSGAVIGEKPGIFDDLGAMQSASLRGANLRGITVVGFRDLSLADLTGANLNGASIGGVEPLLDAIYNNTTCPDGSNSDADGGTCVGHGVP
jgi:uncharacterized protein YjbI with pentapeptide repeats